MSVTGTPSRIRRAVIFGGSGFIGKHTVARLVRAGVEVIVADIRPPSALPEGASYQQCDVRDPIRVSVGAAVDVVYNFAAVHRTPGHADHEYYDTNIAGALNVVEWVESVGTSRLCFTSSISVYGPDEVQKDEHSRPAPTSAYGRSKLLAEQVHQGWADRRAGTQLVIVRPAVVFGPGENGNFTRLATAMSRKRFMYPGRDDVVKACGYVGDLIGALDFALVACDQGSLTFNFCYPHAYTIREICEAFQEVAGYSPPRMLPPGLIEPGMKLLRRMSPDRAMTSSLDRIDKLRTSTNIWPGKLLELGFEWGTSLQTALEDWARSGPVGMFA